MASKELTQPAEEEQAKPKRAPRAKSKPVVDPADLRRSTRERTAVSYKVHSCFLMQQLACS